MKTIIKFTLDFYQAIDICSLQSNCNWYAFRKGQNERHCCERSKRKFVPRKSPLVVHLTGWLEGTGFETNPSE